MLPYPSLVNQDRFKKADRARSALRSRRCQGALPCISRLLEAESPKSIFFLSSGTRGDSRPLGTGALLLLVFLGCSRSSAAPRLGGASWQLLTAGTPLGRVSTPHEPCLTPH